jgi:steroid delta-isomerase-like uncharacterized protein
VSTAFDCLNRRDLERLSAIVVEDVQEDWPMVGHLDGRTALLEYFRALFASIPDLHLDILRMVTDGGSVFTHWGATGTFTGAPFDGIRATGRRIELRGIDHHTIRDGKIVGAFIAYDGLEFAIQAGGLPRHGTFADRMMTSALNAVTRVRSLPQARAQA